MFGKGTKLYSIFRYRCPKCHEGKLYKTRLFEKGIYNMYDECPVCGQPYVLEPGFYWGAMYVGYGLSSGFMLSMLAICIFAFNLSINQALIITLVGVVLLWPIFARMARSIWINIYVLYKPDAKQKGWNGKGLPSKTETTKQA